MVWIEAVPTRLLEGESSSEGRIEPSRDIRIEPVRHRHLVERTGVGIRFVGPPRAIALGDPDDLSRCLVQWLEQIP